MQSITVGFSNFRRDLKEAITTQLGYLTKYAPDGITALSEAEGHIAQVFDKWLKKAFIEAHAVGVQSAIRDCKEFKDKISEITFDPVRDAIYAERAYLEWKR